MSGWYTTEKDCDAFVFDSPLPKTITTTLRGVYVIGRVRKDGEFRAYDVGSGNIRNRLQAHLTELEKHLPLIATCCELDGPTQYLRLVEGYLAHILEPTNPKGKYPDYDTNVDIPLPRNWHFSKLKRLNHIIAQSHSKTLDD